MPTPYILMLPNDVGGTNWVQSSDKPIVECCTLDGDGDAIYILLLVLGVGDGTGGKVNCCLFTCSNSNTICSDLTLDSLIKSGLSFLTESAILLKNASTSSSLFTQSLLIMSCLSICLSFINLISVSLCRWRLLDGRPDASGMSSLCVEVPFVIGEFGGASVPSEAVDSFIIALSSWLLVSSQWTLEMLLWNKEHVQWNICS